MHIAGVVQIGANINDWHQRKPAAAVGDLAGLVGEPERIEIAYSPVRNDVAIDVEASRALVKVKELIKRDLASIERGQSVLDPNVVE